MNINDPFIVATLGIAAIITVILVLTTVITNTQLQMYLRDTVGAVYRVAIKVAATFGEKGISWLRSNDGIQFRKKLAIAAYDAIPDYLGTVPTKAIKLFISKERFATLIEYAFEEIVGLADTLEQVETARPAERQFLE